MDIIELLKYLLLGVVQGFTEPLPVSSSGHLVLLQELLGIGIDDLNFEIIVNAASLFAILFLFRNDIIKIVTGFINYIIKKDKTEYKVDFNYALMIVIGVIPAGLIGFIGKDFIESNLKGVSIVGIGLLITAFALHLIGKNATKNEITNITFKDALVIGVFQVFALIPGISRSGSTMVGGLSRKIKFEETMRFSFMLYIPISLAGLLLSVYDMITATNTDIFIEGYVVAFLASLFMTYFAVKWLYKVVRSGNLKWFSLYCVIVGVTAIVGNYLVEVL